MPQSYPSHTHRFTRENQVGWDLDQVVILENGLNAVQTSPNATLPFCSAPDSTVENGIYLYSCLWGPYMAWFNWGSTWGCSGDCKLCSEIKTDQTRMLFPTCTVLIVHTPNFPHENPCTFLILQKTEQPHSSKNSVQEGWSNASPMWINWLRPE